MTTKLESALNAMGKLIGTDAAQAGIWYIASGFTFTEGKYTVAFGGKDKDALAAIRTGLESAGEDWKPHAESATAAYKLGATLRVLSAIPDNLKPNFELHLTAASFTKRIKAVRDSLIAEAPGSKLASGSILMREYVNAARTASLAFESANEEDKPQKAMELFAFFADTGLETFHKGKLKLPDVTKLEADAALAAAKVEAAKVEADKAEAVKAKADAEKATAEAAAAKVEAAKATAEAAAAKADAEAATLKAEAAKAEAATVANPRDNRYDKADAWNDTATTLGLELIRQGRSRTEIMIAWETALDVAFAEHAATVKAEKAGKQGKPSMVAIAEALGALDI